MKRDNEQKLASPYAFPFIEAVYSEGMALRDYFAAKAMQSSLINHGRIGTSIVDPSQFCEKVAKDAYEIADAMLKERTKQ